MPPPSTEPRIFVSYSRKDGTESARRLRQRLMEEAGLSLWRDISDMEGGRDWWDQIERVIRSPSVEHLVLVLTPLAVESPIVRREGRLARQEGVQVTPVIDSASPPDFKRLPRALAHAHALDPAIPEQWRQLVRILESPSRQDRVPFMVGDLDPDFVQRPREFQELKQALLDQDLQAVAITAALKGAGGFGKTALAQALSHDDDVQEAFHHGILWTTLGERPRNVVDKLNALLRVLRPDAPQHADADAALSTWRETLAEKRCLIVIDDAWRRAEVEPFLEGGPNCARLITTRDTATLPPDPARLKRIDVDEMLQDEAAALLSAGFDAETREANHAELTALAETLGEWPLLVKLANALLRRRVGRGESLTRALEAVRRRYEERGIGAFDTRNAAERNEAATRTLEVSVEALAAEDASWPDRLDDLAVFPEDEPVPLDLVLGLWARTGELDDLDGEDLAVRLHDLSLLLSCDFETRTIRLHDVVRAFLITRTSEERRRRVHGEVAELIRASCGNDWAQLPQGGYAIRYLPMHLAGAEASAELDALLTDPAWMRAKLQGAGAGALWRDYQLHAPSEATRLIGRVLQLVASDLAEDGPDAIAQQLLARLSPEMAKGLDKALETQRHDTHALLVPAGRIFPPPRRELVRLPGHNRSVANVVFPPDGRRLARGYNDGTVLLWDVEAAVEIARLERHTDWVWSVAFAPDGRRLATGSDDRTVRLWDVERGEEITRVEHEGQVKSVAFAPDGRLIATGSEEGTVRLCDVETGAEIAKLEGHEDRVRSVAFAPDGRRLATGSSDKTARLWDAEAGAEIARLEGHEGAVWSVAFAPDGRRLATGSMDQTARLWDAETGAEIARLEGHEGAVAGVAFAPDGRRLATGSLDETARLWDAESRVEIARLEGHGVWVVSVAFAPDGRRLATACIDGTMRLWDAEGRAETVALSGHRGRVTSVTFGPDGRRLATGSSDKTARLWNLETGAEIARFEGHGARVDSVAFAPDGRRLATGSWDDTARVWDAETGAEIARLEGHEGAVFGVAFAPDGRRLATGSVDQTARLWDAETGTEIARLEGHEGVVWEVAFASDGRLLATGSANGTVRLCDARTGAEIAKFKEHEGQIRSVAFAPDGRRLATGSWDRTVRLWDGETGTEIARLEGHGGGVLRVAFAPDGRRLATGSWDRTVRLWDLETRLEIGRMRVDHAMDCLSYAPDGKKLAIGGWSGWALLLISR